MASVTITNLTTEPVLLQELYTTLAAGKSMVVERFRDDLHSMPRLAQLWANGTVSVVISSEVSEDDFLDERVHGTRTYHEPTITPTAAANAPGQAPTLDAIGTTLVAHFTVDTDAAYRIFKIPANFVGDPAFHIHWTKEAGVPGDGDQSGNAVRWRVSYDVWPGSGQDLDVPPSVVEIEDTYDDSGTTTRIVHRTPDTALSGFVANYYVGMCVEAITPTGSALTCEPALINLDLTFTEYVSR